MQHYLKEIMSSTTDNTRISLILGCLFILFNYSVLGTKHINFGTQIPSSGWKYHLAEQSQGKEAQKYSSEGSEQSLESQKAPNLGIFSFLPQPKIQEYFLQQPCLLKTFNFLYYQTLTPKKPLHLT